MDKAGARKTLAAAVAVVVAPTLAVLLLAGCGSSHVEDVEVFDVVDVSFPAAVSVLRGQGFLVSVPYFPPLPAGRPSKERGTLDSYHVLRQHPEAGARARRGSVVTLVVGDTPYRGPIADFTVPKRHPWFARVPNLVGRPYGAALVGDRLSPGGYWVRVAEVGPLSAEASRRGLAAFRIVAQKPRPGSRIPFGGTRRGTFLIEPRISMVEIALGAGEPSPERVARSAMTVAARWAARMLPGFPAAEPVSDLCSVSLEAVGGGRAPLGSICTSSVDLSGRDPVVVYALYWSAGKVVWFVRTRGSAVVETRQEGELPTTEQL